MTANEPDIFMSAVICLVGAPVFWFFDRFVSFVYGFYHAPGCAHRDESGRVIVGQTLPERAIYKSMKVFGAISGALAVVLLLVGATGAMAQPAPMALDTYQSICQTDLDQTETAARFKAAGWSEAPAELDAAFGQDILDPDAEARFVRDAGAGKILAAIMSEKRGLLGTRTRAICFVRLFVETPDQIRADFRARMGDAPDTVTDSDEVRADLWTSLLAGQVIGFRAVKLPEGFWAVTVSNVLINA